MWKTDSQHHSTPSGDPVGLGGAQDSAFCRRALHKLTQMHWPPTSVCHCLDESGFPVSEQHAVSSGKAQWKTWKSEKNLTLSNLNVTGVASQVALVVKHLPAHARDPGSTPGSGRSSGEENGYPLQYSCLENPMDSGAWRATVHGVTQSRTQLSMHAEM